MSKTPPFAKITDSSNCFLCAVCGVEIKPHTFRVRLHPVEGFQEFDAHEGCLKRAVDDLWREQPEPVKTWTIGDQDLEAMRRIQATIHDCNVAAGWWSDLETGERKERNVGEMLALVHSEISEALEGHRKGLNDDHLPDRPMIEVELADAMIRIIDLAGGLGLDITGALRDKFDYNQRRADHKIENRRKDGGKKI